MQCVADCMTGPQLIDHHLPVHTHVKMLAELPLTQQLKSAIDDGCNDACCM